MVSVVVFDLDGTLFDQSSSARRGLRQWLAGLDVVLTNDLAGAWFEARSGTAFPGVRAWSAGPSSGADACGTSCLSSPSPSALLTTWMRRSSPATCWLAYERNWAGYDDVDAALDAVHDCGVVTAILTNGTQEQPKAKWLTWVCSGAWGRYPPPKALAWPSPSGRRRALLAMFSARSRCSWGLRDDQGRRQQCSRVPLTVASRLATVSCGRGLTCVLGFLTRRYAGSSPKVHG